MKHRIGHKFLAVETETAIELLLKELGGSYKLGSIMSWCHGYNVHPDKTFLQRILRDMKERGLIENVSTHGNYEWRWKTEKENVPNVS